MSATISELKEDIESLKKYLSELIKVNLEAIEEMEVFEEERKIFSERICEEYYLDWEKVKNEI